MFHGAEAHDRLIEDSDDNNDDDDDDDSSMADNDDRLSADQGAECSDNSRPTADATDSTNCASNYVCPPTPPILAHLDSSSGSLDP